MSLAQLLVFCLVTWIASYYHVPYIGLYRECCNMVVSLKGGSMADKQNRCPRS